MYDDIMDLQILTRYPWVLSFRAFDDFIIEELVSYFDDDRHLNILLILSISSISSFVFSVVARYDDDMQESHHISPIDDDVTTIFSIRLTILWRYPHN